MTGFLIQRLEDGSSCSLFTMCNALRLFGRKSPAPGEKAWESLIKIGACDTGACIFLDKMAKKLGTQRERVVYRDPRRLLLRVPVDVIVKNPAVGCAFHSALLIGGNQQMAVLVNYRQSESPVAVETVEWERLPLHHRQRKAYALSLISTGLDKRTCTRRSRAFRARHS